MEEVGIIKVNKLMPITRELTQEELDDLTSKGVDPNAYAGQKVTLYTPEEAQAYQQAQQPAPSNVKPSMSSLAAAGKTAEAHAGGYVGGGAGALSGAKAGALAGQ